MTTSNNWSNKITSLYCGKNTWFNLCQNGLGDCWFTQLSSGAGHARYPDLREGRYDGAKSEAEVKKQFGAGKAWLDGDSNDAEFMQIGPYDP